ncbi:glucose-1-phosphate thymidylyltransferase RfbA [Thermosulfurimonas dismutans]|uniref:Glucose-1-phosphate thymidylyltransferase n=1 Tax=Thermosulfurimonas dismutans TaxID=999894 RepID=A0A179D320_9BACT|nr:glucose-1-phosphate thymidylyltransferase RfbA [Thermosulfurimonas dismutans]OAQ19862.1 Glucose-1-phosphate thymidylyltransferase [Thermosulfurimonas dismutans]
MKGVVLAGGSGTRLYPVTKCINKHLLPVYNKPMIYYPLSVLMLARIREIILVVNPEDEGVYRELLSDGSQLGMSISYAIQGNPGGLAHALLSAEELVQGDNVCVLLGDNIFFGHGLTEMVNEARREIEEHGGAYIFGYYVHDPERYGIVEFDEEGRAISLEEKPKKPKSHYAVVGLYFYDPTVFEKARKVKPSKRGEMEITSVNEKYLKEGKLRVKRLGRGFAWFDAGTHDSFLDAGKFVSTIEKKAGLMVGCIEEIAYRNGWIDKKQLKELAKSMEKTDYGKYLLEIAKGG